MSFAYFSIEQVTQNNSIPHMTCYQCLISCPYAGRITGGSQGAYRSRERAIAEKSERGDIPKFRIIKSN